MPNDQKVGFALGLLLLGIVGAFFFRNPPVKTADVPALVSSAEVDAQISEKEFTPYLPGIETDDDSGPAPVSKNAVAADDETSHPEPPHWEVPEFLKRNTANGGERRFANPEKVAPDPIPLISETDSKITTTPTSRTRKYIPEHNSGWETVPPIPLPETSNTTATEPPQAAPSKPAQTHVVQSGDTLSGIASKYLGNSTRFLEIYEANRDLLKNPNDLRVGMKLKIPSRDADRIDSIPAEGPSASASASTRSPTPETASRKPFTRAPVRKTDSKPATEAATAVETPPPAPTTPRGRFAPVRRSPYRPAANSDQTSLDQATSIEVVERAAEETKPDPKTLTQTPPKDLPLDGDHEED